MASPDDPVGWIARPVARGGLPGGGMFPRPLPIPSRLTNEPLPLPLPLVAEPDPRRVEEAVSEPELVSRLFRDVGRLVLELSFLPEFRRGLRRRDAPSSGAWDFRSEPEVDGRCSSWLVPGAAQPLTAAVYVGGEGPFLDFFSPLDPRSSE